MNDASLPCSSNDEKRKRLDLVLHSGSTVPQCVFPFCSKFLLLPHITVHFILYSTRCTHTKRNGSPGDMPLLMIPNRRRWDIAVSLPSFLLLASSFQDCVCAAADRLHHTLQRYLSLLCHRMRRMTAFPCNHFYLGAKEREIEKDVESEGKKREGRPSDL